MRWCVGSCCVGSAGALAAAASCRTVCLHRGGLHCAGSWESGAGTGVSRFWPILILNSWSAWAHAWCRLDRRRGAAQDYARVRAAALGGGGCQDGARGGQGWRAAGPCGIQREDGQSLVALKGKTKGAMLVFDGPARPRGERNSPELVFGNEVSADIGGFQLRFAVGVVSPQCRTGLASAVVCGPLSRLFPPHACPSLSRVVVWPPRGHCPGDGTIDYGEFRKIVAKKTRSQTWDMVRPPATPRL